jgi:SAM-dependent methyltransferase/uncharacterized protein YbaR (Trm112 family)
LRLEHFETLRPVCPQCRQTNQYDYPLKITTIIEENDDGLIEGILNCSNQACQLEYPVIDGIPIIVPNVRKYITDNLYHITARNDLSGAIESMVGDCVGAGTHFDVSRQHLSSYAWDHYGDLCQHATREESSQSTTPSSIVACLNAGLELTEPPGQSPIIDMGCSVGRTTFELAEKFNQLVLGIDVNFSMLRIAQGILRKESCTFPLRRNGLVYDQVRPETAFVNDRQVDFWACDALALPIPKNSFGFASALNILDSVVSPYDLLVSIADCLSPSGCAILACPYDWSSAATPMESWIGGHSQRSETHGSPETFLRSLLTPSSHVLSLDSLKLLAEIENLEWNVRVHDRSRTVYSVHVAAVQKQAAVSL